MTESTRPDTEQLLRDYADFWNGDFSKVSVIAEGGAIYDSILPEGKVVGRDAIEEYMRGLHTREPDAHITVGETVIDDGVAMYEWTMTGTDRGELNGMSKTLIEDGKIVEDQIYHE
ncbi:MAG: nuclear transport factor 2 family protein [Halobacteriota archaeon]